MEEEKISEKFIQGFNHGYILQKFKPKLQSKFAKMENTGNYLTGLRAGGNKREMEIRMSKIRGDRGNSKDLDRS